MDKLDKPQTDRHLTDAELFTLAAPPTGEPGALPAHLSTCEDCSRALQEWQISIRQLADEDAGEIERRSPDEWKAAEDATMAAIRRAGRPGRQAHPLRWVVGIAASLVVIGLAMPVRHGAPAVAAAPTPAAEGDLSAADRADDELLRQTSYLAAGGDDDAGSIVGGRL